MFTHTLLILFNAIFMIYVRYTSFAERLARATNESSLSNMEDEDYGLLDTKASKAAISPAPSGEGRG